jgi:formylglycine-generating enzyme required for sulfatase activity
MKNFPRAYSKRTVRLLGAGWRCFALLLFLWLPDAPSAQTLFYIRNGCAVDKAEMGQNHYVFDPSNEAQQIISAIMGANLLEPNFVIKSGDVKNALATVEGGQRYIIYNTTYVERIKRSGGSDWPAFYVFAHEIGHHLNNHRFDLSDNAKSKEQELQADVYAGGMLYRLGATLDQAQSGIGIDFSDDSRTHPPRKARIEAVASGWKRASDQSGGVQPKPVVIALRQAEQTPGGAEQTPGGGNSFTDPLVGTFILVKGGTFTMGCTSEQSDCDTDEKPTHQVTLRNFYIGETEVTQAQWRAVMGTNPSGFKNCDKCPVENVSWMEVQDFISELNSRSSGVRYRLPTEAEWEYAARGGLQSRGYKYAGSKHIDDDIAWYSGNAGGKTRPVKGKLPNELGLYDMSGNVWEWCRDWYGSYSATAQSDPKGPDQGSFRVLRGGSWSYVALGCRASIRVSSTPAGRSYTIGFRLASAPQ